MTKSETYIKAGGIGAVIAAICCFTPVLVILLGIIGLGAITGYFDYVLIPALLICLGLLVYGLVLRKKSRQPVVIMRSFEAAGESVGFDPSGM